jgi:hypothetical protein
LDLMRRIEFDERRIEFNEGRIESDAAYWNE